MRLATAEQSRQMDQKVESEYGVHGELLMEVAGSLAAREIEQSFFPELTKGRVIFLAGSGHNGGDAYVAARHLHGAGFRDIAIVSCLSKNAEMASLTKIQMERAKRFGISVLENQSLTEIRDLLAGSRLVVDGLLGIGLSRSVDSPVSEWIELVNASRVPCVALDVPSGLDVDSGEVRGVAIKANATLTFGLPKPGFFTGAGPSFSGRLRVLPLGFPQELTRKVATSHFAFTEKLARRYLPKPSSRSHKSSHGYLQVMAGGDSYWGAAVLTCLAAYRLGAGYVALKSLKNPVEIVAQYPEILGSQWVSGEYDISPKATALAFGPGLEHHDGVGKFLSELKDRSEIPVVLDATGLDYVRNLGKLPSHWVLTPHAGELGRMLDVSPLEIEKNRLFYVKKAAEVFGCVVLLKGFRTLISFEDRVMVILSGNAALAKAGTGDVLTGMIGGLLAQGLPPIQATATAAYLHGKMADDWVKMGKDSLSLSAGDLAELIPPLIARLRGEAWTPL